MVQSIAIVALLTAGSLGASPLTYFSSRASFNAAEPGLPVQVFQPLSSPAVIAAPLSSTTNNGDFAPGSILPGIAISNSNSALSSRGLYLAGSSVASNFFEDPLIMSFAPGASAVGADFFASSGGSSWAGTFTAEIYNGTTLLDAPTFSEAAGQSTFFGFSSTTAVTSISITFQPTTDVDWAPHVENIAFGSAAVSAAPEPADAALFLLGVGGCALWFSRRRAS